jgi:hypothetical protein
MVEDAAVAVGKLAAFFDIESNEIRITDVVERSSVERMRQLERLQSDQWVSTKGKRPDIPFIRTAVSGNWRSKLSATAIAEIEAAWAPLMAMLGYEIVSQRSTDQSALQSYATR